MATHSRNMATKYSEFVKLTDVHSIVQEMTFPLLQGLKVREEDAMRLSNQVATISIDMKK